MTSRKGHMRGFSSMGERNTRYGGRSEGRANTGNDFIRNTGGFQSLDLFSCAPEKHGIPALEPDHAHRFARARDHQGMDRRLAHLLFAATLSHARNQSLRTSQRKDLLRHEILMQNHV